MRLAAVCLLVLLAAAAPAAAQRPGDEFFDARADERAAVEASGDRSARTPTRRMRRARRALERSLGDQGVVDVDALTGTPRVVARLDGTLTPPRAGDPAEIAKRYVRENLAALGLSTSDLGSFGAISREPVGDDAVQIRWRQFHEGIPALDNELRVTVTGDGEVLNVLGSPQHDLDPTRETPRLSAADALRAAGATDVPRTRSGPSGPRRTTRFAGGHEASLVLFGQGDSTRLAWRVLFHESSTAVWDVVVDAANGRALRRANLVRQLAPVFERHPGVGTTFDFDTAPAHWFDGTGQLSGPYAMAWSDVNDLNQAAPDAGEEVEHDADYQPFTPQGAADNENGDCADLPCTWDPDDAQPWQANREHGTLQAFYYVNRFHDWLAEKVQFTGFEGADRVLVQTFDGAAGPGGLPDADHLNNANMLTPPEGSSPVMQLYLFGAPFRDVHAADDAAIVYHEYAHGLTDRLVTDADGYGALGSPQAGAMAEGWSDYYAMDYLVARGYEAETAADQEHDVGVYPGGIRRQPIDTPVAAGGFTYGDFGSWAGGPEVHDDGEIWAQTLWDIRAAIGPVAARVLITDALSLSPPEPSFLDMRNAILQADMAASSGANRAALWQVFAARGMGFFAGALDGYDADPVEDFMLPPDPAQTGVISGTVTGDDSGAPVQGVAVGVGGHTTVLEGGPAPLTEVTDADGAFALDVPAGTYGKVAFSASHGYDALVKSPVTVEAGETTTLDVVLRRDWAASAGGASIAGHNWTFHICTPEQAIDQSLSTGWSAGNEPGDPDRYLIVRLPAPVKVSAFGLDPGPACGDDWTAGTKAYEVQTSADGANWTTAAQGSFGRDDGGRLNMVTPTAGARRVRYVRLWLRSAQDESPGEHGASFIDFSELEVFGARDNLLPSGSLLASASIAPVGTPIAFDASWMRDPDGRIVSYRWNFGDGTPIVTTTAPAASHAYASAGTRTATVFAQDSAGEVGTASVTVQISSPPPPQPPPPQPPPPQPPPPQPPVEFDEPAAKLPKRGRRGKVRVRVRCDLACAGKVKLKVSRRTARRLRLGRSRTVARKRVRLREAGSERVTVRLRRKVRRRMRRAEVRTLRVRAKVAVRDANGQRERERRTLRVRR